MEYDQFKAHFIDKGLIFADGPEVDQKELHWVAFHAFKADRILSGAISIEQLGAEWNADAELQRKYINKVNEEKRAIRDRFPGIGLPWQYTHTLRLEKMPSNLRMSLVYNVPMLFRNYDMDGREYTSTTISERFSISWIDENYEGQLEVPDYNTKVDKVNIVDMYHIIIE